MSGLEVLGALAAASQITVYLGRLVQQLADVRRDLKDAFNRFSAQDQQLEELTRTLHCLQNCHWLPENVISLSLKPIEARIDAIRGIILHWVSKSARKQGLKSVFTSRSLYRTCQQIEANFRDLDSLKMTLLLHISAWNSSTLYKIHDLSEASYSPLKPPNLDNSYGPKISILDMHKFNQWFGSGRKVTEGMGSGANTKRSIKKPLTGPTKLPEAGLEAAIENIGNKIDNIGAQVANAVTMPDQSMNDNISKTQGGDASKGYTNSFAKPKAGNADQSGIRAEIINNAIEGSQNDVITGAKVRGDAPIKDIRVEGCGVIGDSNKGTTGLDIDTKRDR